ncbi:MAG: BatD family protein, partial [Bacteroidales bacterium]
IFFVAQKGWAQDISFTAAAPKVLRAGEQFQLVYTINRNVDNFFPPEFGEFRFLGGPSTGSSTSISMVNGKTTRTSTFSYTYYLQAPSNAGKYTIGAATATYKKDNVSSNALEIEIVSSGQSGNVQSKSSNTQGQPGAASETAAGDDIFLCLVTDKNTAYVGEQITAWIKIYTKLRITGLDQRFKGPDFIGFYQQDVEIPPFSLEREKVGDDIYYAGVLKKVILYPQKSGKITIDPFEVLVEVQKQSKRRSLSIFDEFFGQQYDRSRINLRSKPVRFTIKQLPYPRPDDFGGAVGKFGIQASANESAVSTNDAITFKVVVSGRGNLKLIDDVNPDFPPAFDVFEPIKKVRIDNTSDGKSGKLSLEYTVIPRHAGDFKIPPFSLSYFNPAIAGYENIKTRDFDITVLKSDDDSTTVISGNLSKEDIELLGSDIRYITVKTNLKKGGHYIFGSKWFFALYVIVLILFILILILRKEQIKRTANIVRYKNRKAKKVAAKRLRKARALMKRNRKEEFYEEIGRALWNYLSDKLSIQVSDLSKEKAKEKLVSLTIEEQLINEFFDLVDTCEFARFAPGKADTDLQNLYNSASKTISRLDQKL